MADSGSPYKRQGTNSWKELLDQVNEELENPEPGCSAIEPIEEPEECHRWAKSDIREVHDKLNEMPGDCFTFQPIPDLWKVSIIEDIEEQLAEAWCECGEEQCCEPCPNCNDGPPAEEEVASFTNSGNCCTPSSACQHCSEDFCQGVRCGNGGSENIGPILGPWGDWQDGMCDCCRLEPEIEDLEEEIEALEEKIQDLEDAKTECRNGCTNPETQAACQAACDSTYDPQIEDAEMELEEKEEELEEKQMEKDEAQMLADDGKSEMKANAAAMKSCIEGCCGGASCGDCLINHIPSNPHGPMPATCEDAKPEDSDWVGTCCSCPFSACWYYWSLQSRGSSNWTPDDLGNWRSAYSGFFDMDDEAQVYGFRSSWCTCESLFACSCTKFPGMGAPGVACSSCGGGGMMCKDFGEPGYSKTEWRSVIWRSVSCFDPFDCEDGNPCDGEPPEGGPIVG